jgi:hypothetical protein
MYVNIYIWIQIFLSRIIIDVYAYINDYRYVYTCILTNNKIKQNNIPTKHPYMSNFFQILQT